VPFRYSTHPAPSGTRASRPNVFSSSKSSERAVTVRSALARIAIQTARSIAIGITKPSL
jgi:hypothetical protein